MQSVMIPGDQTSTVRISLGEEFTELTFDSNDFDAIGIDLVGGQSYRITLDPAVAALLPSMNFGLSSIDPLIADILDSQGNSLGLSDDDGGSGTASTLIFTPSTSDTYFVVVGPGDDGWWTLEVNEFTAPADDFSNLLDASNPISIWETQDGHISFDGDTDTIALSLEAGAAVDITLYSNDGGFFGELADTEIISFVDDSGTPIDPSNYETAESFGAFITGSDIDAHQITFTPTTTGNYFLTVGAGPGEAIGDYSVSISAADRGVFSVRDSEVFVATGNPEIDMFFLENFDPTDNIIYSDRNSDGTITLTYSIPGANPGFSPGKHNVVNSVWTNDFAPPSGLILDTWLGMIETIEGFTNIDFVEVPDTGVEAGTLRIGTTGVVLGSASGALVTGWGGAPGWMMAGETWINYSKGVENVGIIQSFGATQLTLGNFLLNRTLHEFGHTFGLNHPDFSTLSARVDPSMLGQEYSLMSRAGFAAFPGALTTDLYPQTLMWFDIQALQAAYGVDMMTTSGADTYVVNTNVRNFSTIWDAGGKDTLQLNGAANTIIDLTPGTWQNVGTEINYYSAPNTVVGVNRNTVFIAPDTTIENATGSAGDDRITGNTSKNTLIGNAGDDTLRGEAGDDQLFSGMGDDRAEGGGGDDLIRTGPGKDTLLGGSGDDTLGASNKGDLLRGEGGQDLLLGSNGNDRLFGGSSADTLLGGSGADTLFGDDGFDRLRGQDGNDVLEGGAGGDFLDGDAGTDTASYANAGMGVQVRLWNGDGTAGEALGDTLLEIENLAGSAFNDSLAGDAGDNRIDGNFGDDIIQGLGGADQLTGDRGDDLLIGGAGDDTFLYFAGDGADTITDFAAGAGSDDAIRLFNMGSAFDTFAEVLAAASDDGAGNAVIDFGGSDTITLQSLSVAQLHQDDFVFG